jgi:hypothetical protein
MCQRLPPKDRPRKTNTKAKKASSLAEMLIALGIAGSVIFVMIVVAARTAKQSKINQERYIAAQGVSESVELAIVSRKYIASEFEDVYDDICAPSHDAVYVGLLADPGQTPPVDINTANLVLKDEGYYLPLRKDENGEWEICMNCDPDEVELYRGTTLQRVETSQGSDEYYISLESEVVWEIFGEEETLSINSRLDDICAD